MDNRGRIYNLPYQTEEILNGFDPAEKCYNLGLLLDKYIRKSVFEKPSREKPYNGKAPWLLDIFRPKIGSQTPNNHIDKLIAENIYNRWHAMMKAQEADIFELTLDWRMIIGLGGETVLETDITLHHLYGIPIIPGSALKGLTRAFAAGEEKDYYIPEDEDKPQEERKPSMDIEKDHSTLKRIFGRQEKAGTVCFFDAMPLRGEAQFVLDIINPHYPGYYNSLQSNNITAPTNDQQPNPVFFLAVEKTTFTFALVARNSKDKGDVELVKEWLQKALQKYGVGGKTSAGYGYFKAAQQNPRPKNLPQFSKGDSIRGVVVDDQITAKYIESKRASKCLQYRPFSTDQVLILIDPMYEEAKQWKVRNESICLFIEERVEDNRIILICEPKKKLS